MLVDRRLESVSYQEEIGRLQMIKWEGPGIVISERWPSWSFALKAANCERIFTCSKFRSAKVKEEFRATDLGDTLFGSVEDLCKAASEYEKLLVFLQGSEEFCEKVKHLLNHLQSVGVSEIISNGREFAKQDALLRHNFIIAHSEVGGITNGSWSL